MVFVVSVCGYLDELTILNDGTRSSDPALVLMEKLSTWLNYFLATSCLGLVRT